MNYRELLNTLNNLTDDQINELFFDLDDYDVIKRIAKAATNFIITFEKDVENG